MQFCTWWDAEHGVMRHHAYDSESGQWIEWTERQSWWARFRHWLGA